MASSWSPDAPGDVPARPAYRPPLGIPSREGRKTVSTAVAIALHALVILALLAPVLGPKFLQEIQGAGGDEPAGGGGGGTLGTGGDRTGVGVVERLHYIQIAPSAPAATPAPVVPPAPKPTVTPAPVPPPVVKPPTTPAAPELSATSQQTSPVASAPTSGTGGGTGADGTAGSGPGTGGGVGSGTGSGRGTAGGPGTGGGDATIYPPQATELFLPPMPVPDKVKGTQLVAQFDVDSTGRVLSFEFTPTRDGGYNRKLNDVLKAVRFKAAVRADGQPIRAKGSLTYVF